MELNELADELNDLKRQLDADPRVYEAMSCLCRLVQVAIFKMPLLVGMAIDLKNENTQLKADLQHLRDPAASMVDLGLVTLKEISAGGEFVDSSDDVLQFRSRSLPQKGEPWPA
jgi:hypothetical protein